MNGLIIFGIILVLWYIAGYYSLRDIVRNVDGIPDYEPSIKEVLVYMIISFVAMQSIKKRNKK